MLEKIDALFQEYNRPDVPGASVGVIREGKIAFRKSYGLAHLGKKIPVDEFTNFRIASVSKQFTAMAIMILMERGKLDYEDPLEIFFSGFPKIGKTITLCHLLTHTSGLVDYEDIIPKERTVPIKDQDVLELLKTQHGTYFTPGTSYQYSNTGYALLALIVEKLSGRCFSDFMKENIFDPLGMKMTLVYEDGKNAVENRAYGYKEKKDGGFEFSDQGMTSSVLGDGGIYSSLEDYYKWDQALYGEMLVSRKTLEEAFTSGRLVDGTSIGYGFGWRIDERHGVKVVHHNGRSCGFSAAVRRVPERETTLVVFTNRAGTGAADRADKLLDEMLKGR